MHISLPFWAHLPRNFNTPISMLFADRSWPCRPHLSWLTIANDKLVRLDRRAACHGRRPLKTHTMGCLWRAPRPQEAIVAGAISLSFTRRNWIRLPVSRRQRTVSKRLMPPQSHSPPYINSSSRLRRFSVNVRRKAGRWQGSRGVNDMSNMWYLRYVGYVACTVHLISASLSLPNKVR